MTNVGATVQDQGVDGLVADISAALDPETPESAPESTTPAASPEASPADPETQAPASQQSSEGTPAPAEKAPPTPDESKPDNLTPEQGGEPFTFRVDGRVIAPEGARIVGDEIRMPRATWQTQMHGLLADRSAIKEREGQYRQQVQAERAGRQQIEAQHAAIMAEMQQIFADPEAMRAKLDNWQINGPLMLAQIEARAAKAEAEAFRRQQAEVERSQQERELVPRQMAHVEQVVEGWLTDAGVKWDADAARWQAWFKEVWEDNLNRDGLPTGLFYRESNGEIALNEDKVYRLFQREVSRARSQQQATIVAEKKTTMNAAAIAPPKPKPPVPGKPVARKPDGTFTSPTKSQEPFDADKWLRERDYTT